MMPADSTLRRWARPHFQRDALPLKVGPGEAGGDIRAPGRLSVALHGQFRHRRAPCAIRTMRLLLPEESFF